jgi:hypothetical protein
MVIDPLWSISKYEKALSRLFMFNSFYSLVAATINYVKSILPELLVSASAKIF